MAYLYLVAFKAQTNGSEDDINYALRELLDEHCSYSIPAGKTEVFGPYTPKHKLAEICWLMQQIGFTENDYYDVIANLRALYTKTKGHKPETWFDTFLGGGLQDAERRAREERRLRWKDEKYSVFRHLIRSWIKPRVRRSL